MKRLLLITILITSSFCFAQSPTNGLVAYYGFENNSNSHNNMYNLSNLHSSGTAVTYGTGANGIGSSAQFNNTALKTTAISPAITNTFTICFWQKMTPLKDKLMQLDLKCLALHSTETLAIPDSGQEDKFLLLMVHGLDQIWILK